MNLHIYLKGYFSPTELGYSHAKKTCNSHYTKNEVEMGHDLNIKYKTSRKKDIALGKVS